MDPLETVLLRVHLHGRLLNPRAAVGIDFDVQNAGDFLPQILGELRDFHQSSRSEAERLRFGGYLFDSRNFADSLGISSGNEAPRA
nr:hypothetical protein Itr_chr02CG25000 [Ipomoea trifida]